MEIPTVNRLLEACWPVIAEVLKEYWVTVPLISQSALSLLVCVSLVCESIFCRNLSDKAGLRVGLTLGGPVLQQVDLDRLDGIRDGRIGKPVDTTTGTAEQGSGKQEGQDTGRQKG